MTQNTSDAVLARMMALHPKIIDLTLDRMWRLLDALGNPQNDLPPVIHIAGTNGKGSTQAMIRAGLEADGHRVHAYTSPHLARFHERIRLAGTLIDEAALSAVLEFRAPCIAMWVLLKNIGGLLDGRSLESICWEIWLLQKPSNLRECAENYHNFAFQN